jgi:hypothetical protein
LANTDTCDWQVLSMNQFRQYIGIDVFSTLSVTATGLPAPRRIAGHNALNKPASDGT